MTKPKTSVYKEQYTVKFRYKKPDGFWETLTETVLIPVFNPNREKQNHSKACDEILRQYPSATIIDCSYA